MLELIMFIVKLAPYGVFCLMMKLGLGIGLYEILKLANIFSLLLWVLIFSWSCRIFFPDFCLHKIKSIYFPTKMRE